MLEMLYRILLQAMLLHCLCLNDYHSQIGMNFFVTITDEIVGPSCVHIRSCSSPGHESGIRHSFMTPFNSKVKPVRSALPSLSVESTLTFDH